MASNIEEILSYTPPLEESLIANLATDHDLKYDLPFPDISPSPPHLSAETIRSVLRAKLEPILTSSDEAKPVRKKKRRKVLKQSQSVHIESAMDTTLTRPLPPLDTDLGSSERLAHSPLADPTAPSQHFPALTQPYEPAQLISQEDICTETTSMIGNPITSLPQQGQLLMKSDKAFVERKDGRFVPLTKDNNQSRSNTASLPWGIMGSVSRVTLARFCNAVFNTLGLMAYSLLAGISVWHAVFLFTLASYTNLDLNLVANLSKLSLPSHSLFHLLSSLSIVYLTDRIDVVRLNKQFLTEVLALKRISSLLDIIALFLTSLSFIISLSLMYLDLQIHYFSLPHTNSWRDLWPDLLTNSSLPPTTCPTVLFRENSEYFYPVPSPISERATVLKSLVLIRAVLNLIGWLFIISCPTGNRWYSHLRELMAEESEDA